MVYEPLRGSETFADSDDSAKDKGDKELARIERDDELVVMEAEADLSSLTDSEAAMVRRVARLSEQNFRTFVKKANDYGGSYRSTGLAETTVETGLFDDPTKASAYHILVRSLDKRHRLYGLLFGEDSTKEVNETVVETALDAANYYLMLAALLEEDYDSDLKEVGFRPTVGSE
jgi:hypothetical protein